ncbi:Zn-dependent oxidoreductase, NADPH:quinone reductase [Frankia canadensis]|uniref:Zn-dependent oxidoreductase, NADPH:quinone reductase n=1 Tax=Frankia canadensis TaxID=1836972 RepID=A0A2I2KW47_9ACTN|nr:zinc-binding dehydrogenase [Frankia canadensis]SNQ49889.1 Zn-dependent oxidoreductase, NADPH:quinone reductase [Frankia canadensis]SOU57179.1 Zn-dependent oxidoreductase, NADPH:quinone reductase [Frankia canadensis]
MYAIRLHEFGPADNLRYEEVDDPRPGPGEVRIAVEAAGVHLIDTRLRAGVASGPLAVPSLPTIPGREVAGTVDAVGDNVDEGWLGQRVVAHLGPRGQGYAQLAVREVEHVHPVAPALDASTAVAMIGTGRTALGVLDVAELTADDVVLITAAAGGLGSLLVQAARNAGAVAVGLAGGAAKTAAVRRLGADVAVDYRRPGWPDEVRAALDGRSVTVTLDGVGGDTGRAALELTGPAGRFLVFGWSAGAPTPITTADVVQRGLLVASVLGARMLRRPGGLAALEEAALAAATAGTLVPAVHTFPLAEAAAAHAALENRGTIGKVVLLT